MCGPPAHRCGSQSLAFTCRRHLRVSRSAPEGCRGNYSLAATPVWFHCLTPRLTSWNTRALKLRAHSGKPSMFPQGTSGLTKQLRWVGIITMGRKKNFRFFHLLLIHLICSNPDLMHLKTESIFSPAAPAPFMGDWKSCRARRTILRYWCLNIFHRPAAPQTQNHINVQSY